MAWLIRQRPTLTCTLPTVSKPSGAELLIARNEFGDANPSLFFRNTEWTSQGVHLPVHLLPNEVTVTKRKQVLPDILNLAGWGISERFKDLIESFDLEVHQFHPVSVKSRKYPAVTFFAMIVGYAVDNQIELSECDPIALRPGSRYSKIEVPRIGTHKRLAINRRATQDRNLWISTDIFDTLTCSDQLYSAIKQAEITCLEFIQVREV